MLFFFLQRRRTTTRRCSRPSRRRTSSAESSESNADVSCVGTALGGRLANVSKPRGDANAVGDVVAPPSPPPASAAAAEPPAAAAPPANERRPRPPCPESNAAYRPDSERERSTFGVSAVSRARRFRFRFHAKSRFGRVSTHSSTTPTHSRPRRRRGRRPDEDDDARRATGYRARRAPGTTRGYRAPRAAGIHRATRRRRKVERDGNLTSRIDRLGFQTLCRRSLAVHARRISRRIGRGGPDIGGSSATVHAKTTSVSRRSARAARLGMCRNVPISAPSTAYAPCGFRQLGGGGGGARERGVERRRGAADAE